MPRVYRALPFLCAVALTACAMRAQQPQAQDKPKSSSTLITADEIDQARPNVGTAFDAVQLLRPRWFRARDVLALPAGNEMQMAQVHVYMDDRDMGDVEYLKSIPADRIYTLRYMSTTEVGARYGPSSGPGIVVTLKS
jgi:hypothetical protein